MSQELGMTRRGFASALGVTGALAVLGCGKGAQSQTTAASPESAADPRQMIVYRDPTCPCCENWAALAQDAGYKVQVIDRPDMPAIKAKYGVPEALRSCHTSVTGGLAFEGHVPLQHVERLLREKPAGVLGLAVAGMPAGSPGMEVPGGTVQAYDVVAFRQDGSTTLYARQAAV